MPAHIKPFDNGNVPIVDITNNIVPSSFFNRVRLHKKETFTYQLPGFESVCVLGWGTCDITVDGVVFSEVGQRKHLWGGKPDSVYVPVAAKAEITCLSDEAEIYIGGGAYEEKTEPFRITPEDSEKVQYGSDDTKTHRKIYHVLDQKVADKKGRLLVSELFTVGAGGWSGFPPHKHDEDRMPEESAFEEIYYFKFNPAHGFGAQFTYVHEDDFGPVHHVKDESTIILDKGYHPVVAAPGYEMYYFTILVGKTQKSLIQHFEERHRYQMKTIPGLSDMIAKFKK